MPELKTAKREIFCRYMASGDMTQIDAYGAAGYTPNAANASVLANKDEVKARIAELKREKEEENARFKERMLAKGVDPDSPIGQIEERVWSENMVREMLAKNAQLAQACGNFKDAKDSLELLGKSLGMFVSKDSGNDRDNSGAKVSIALVHQATGSDQGSGGGGDEDERNPLSPRLRRAKDAERVE